MKKSIIELILTIVIIVAVIKMLNWTDDTLGLLCIGFIVARISGMAQRDCQLAEDKKTKRFNWWYSAVTFILAAILLTAGWFFK